MNNVIDEKLLDGSVINATEKQPREAFIADAVKELLERKERKEKEEVQILTPSEEVLKEQSNDSVIEQASIEEPTLENTPVEEPQQVPNDFNELGNTMNSNGTVSNVNEFDSVETPIAEEELSLPKEEVPVDTPRMEDINEEPQSETNEALREIPAIEDDEPGLEEIALNQPNEIIEQAPSIKKVNGESFDNVINTEKSNSEKIKDDYNKMSEEMKGYKESIEGLFNSAIENINNMKNEFDRLKEENQMLSSKTENYRKAINTIKDMKPETEQTKPIETTINEQTPEIEEPALNGFASPILQKINTEEQVQTPKAEEVPEALNMYKTSDPVSNAYASGNTNPNMFEVR